MLGPCRRGGVTTCMCVGRRDCDAPQVSSVMFFKNPVSVLNWAGSFIAIFGTYLYSIATEKHAAEKKAAAAKKA
jgi:hypothetical protein